MNIEYYAPFNRLSIEELYKAFFHNNGPKTHFSYEDGTIQITINGQGYIEVVENQFEFKRFAYDVFSKFSGRSLPWGILTGVRPGKLVDRLRQENNNQVEIYDILTNDYMINPSKAKLIVQISDLQEPYKNNLKIKKYCLYIHIPFCPSICSYCSFTSTPIKGKESLLDPYINFLEHEIDSIIGYYNNTSIESIYIGGGTPSVLSAKQINKLMEYLHRIFPKVSEITFEAGRVDTLDREKINTIAMYSNRISLNAQTSNTETLKRIGRTHAFYDLEKSFFIAREAGIKTINSDLIGGLPGENISVFKKSLMDMDALKPENLTVHMLAVKKGAQLKSNYHYNNKDSNDYAQVAYEYVTDRGYLPYYLYRQKQILGNLENIGYSKDGHVNIYNIAMMEEVCDIIAVGAGSVSKVFDNRGRFDSFTNYRDITLYMSKFNDLLRNKKAWLSERRNLTLSDL
ncbi:MAG: coproporphyrinogen dehydrogenase HemZ [Tissierellia bacterium]|nr:coproporphyrinogen dehydrogenase HemZ [Tissierellia bacterium]